MAFARAPALWTPEASTDPRFRKLARAVVRNDTRDRTVHALAMKLRFAARTLLIFLGLTSCGEKGPAMSNNNTSSGSPGSGASTGSAGGSASSGGTNAGGGSGESMSGFAGFSTGIPAESGSPVSSENDASSSGVTATTTDAAAADAQDSSGGTVTTSCLGTSHPLCIDFEDGKVDPPWTLPASDAAVETSKAAHGRYALHLSNLHSHPTLYLQTPQMPGIKDQLWGRFYN
jgi:hypothetical protein